MCRGALACTPVVAGFVVTAVAVGFGSPTLAKERGSIADVALSRVTGVDRIATAVAISRRVFGSASTVVLARADDGADALTGVPLAFDLGGPILLVPRDEVPEMVLGGTRAAEDEQGRAARRTGSDLASGGTTARR